MIRLHPPRNGFTLPELMATIAIAAILAGFSLVTFSRQWKAAQLQTTARTLQAWLEDQRKLAMHQSGGCSIAIDRSNASLASSGATIQIGETTTTPNVCHSQAELLLRNVTSNSSALQLAVSPTDANRILMSFRGTSSSGSTTNLSSSGSLELRLSLPSLSEQRCIKLANPLGLVRAGRANDADSVCIYQSAY